MGVEVVGVAGPSDDEGGASVVLPEPVGESSELMSIVAAYQSLLLLGLQCSNTVRFFHPSPIARGCSREVLD